MPQTGSVGMARFRDGDVRGWANRLRKLPGEESHTRQLTQPVKPLTTLILHMPSMTAFAVRQKVPRDVLTRIGRRRRSLGAGFAEEIARRAEDESRFRFPTAARVTVEIRPAAAAFVTGPP